jgi:hypothetical protein
MPRESCNRVSCKTYQHIHCRLPHTPRCVELGANLPPPPLEEEIKEELAYARKKVRQRNKHPWVRTLVYR